MKFLEALFKHKWILLVLLFCSNILFVYEHPAFIIGQICVISWMVYKRISKAVTGLFIVIAFFHMVIVYHSLNHDYQFSDSFIAIMTDEVKIDGQTMRGFLKDENGNTIYFAYTFKSKDEKQFWQSFSLSGKKIFVQAELNEIELPAHRYAFHMGDYLKSKGAVSSIQINGLQLIGEKKSIRSFIASQRYNIANKLEESLTPLLAQEAKALLIGIQDGLDQDVERAYQKLGITHLFAISGLHVALLSVLLYEALLRCRVRKELAMIILLVFLPVYALLAGGAPSIWRAVLLVEIIAILKLFNRLSSTDDALSIVCIVFLTISPYSLFQIGFQLSYIATFSLIYSAKYLEKQSNLFLQNFIMTVVCQLLTYPLLLLHFYELSMSSFIANILFVPLFSFIIVPLNLIILLCAYFAQSLLTILIRLYEPFRENLNDVFLWLKDVPYQMWVPGKPDTFELIGLYVSVFTAFYLFTRKKWVSAITILIIPGCILTFKANVNDELQISFINVGQGDSILIELPKREHVILIDSGGVLRFQTEHWKEKSRPYEVGRQVVVPYLKGKGISKIDTFILTHADADHVEGAEEVLEEIRVNEIHISPNSYKDLSMKDVLAMAQKKKIVMKEIIPMEWMVGDVRFAYLSPHDTVYEGNNDSLVLYLQYGQFKALFTGDLEVTGEKLIINRYPLILKDLTVLKAGHHGSKTSSSEEFVEHTNPQITVFTAGKNNRFGHPAEEVVERFENKGLSIFNTGIDGTIEFSIEKGGAIRSFNTTLNEKKAQVDE